MALADYLQSSLYHARTAAIRKWWVASRRPSSLASAASGHRGEHTLVYKEPFLAFAPELAYRAVPDARLLYISRDGRDVADSLVRSYDVLTDEKLADLDNNELHIGRRVGELHVPWWVGEGETAVVPGRHPVLACRVDVAGDGEALPGVLRAPGSWPLAGACCTSATRS